jgi:hypothetical protein
MVMASSSFLGCRLLKVARPRAIGKTPSNGEWRMANGEWRMANGEWRMANGGWRMAKGKHRGIK